MRWAIVGSETRNACAISAVVRPPSSLQRQGRPGLGSQYGVTRDEYQPQQIIADFIIGFRFDRPPIVPWIHIKLVHQRVLAVPHALVSQVVEGTTFGSCHEPGTRIVGDPGPGPLFERRDESILGKLLGEAYIAHQAGQACDEPRGLDSPYDVYGARDIRGFHNHGCHHVDAGSASQGHRAGAPPGPSARASDSCRNLRRRRRGESRSLPRPS